MNFPYRKNVAVLILNNKQEILMVKMEDRASWKFVQGGVKKGESLEETALREIREEVGLTKIKLLAQSAYINKYDWPKGLQEQKKRRGQKQRFFLAKLIEEQKIVPLESEIKAWKWVPLDEVERHITCEDLLTAFKEIRKELKP
jgi:putative (di)nucleoside polyphosphate hydrolase